jgi:hypothetical protein
VFAATLHLAAMTIDGVSLVNTIELETHSAKTVTQKG